MIARRFSWDASGAAAAEFAILGPVMIALLFGIVQGGVMLWTQFGLQQATERAARCGSINSTQCGSVAQIQAYASANSLGRSVPPGTFIVSTQACGTQVAATWTASVLTYSMPLSASSCFPK